MIQTLLFVSGINTLLQALFGTRLPTVIGGSFAYVIPILYIIHDSSLQQIPDPQEVSFYSLFIFKVFIQVRQLILVSGCCLSLLFMPNEDCQLLNVSSIDTFLIFTEIRTNHASYSRCANCSLEFTNYAWIQSVLGNIFEVYLVMHVNTNCFSIFVPNIRIYFSTGSLVLLVWHLC